MNTPYLIHTLTDEGKVYFAGFPVTKMVKNGAKISYYFQDLFLGTTGIFVK
jgi:hypothetical protein